MEVRLRKICQEGGGDRYCLVDGKPQGNPSTNLVSSRDFQPFIILMSLDCKHCLK